MVLIDKFDGSIEAFDKVAIKALASVMVVALIASIAPSELSINTRGIIRASVWPVKTAHTAIIYFLTAAVLGAVGQFLYKDGADRLAPENMQPVVTFVGQEHGILSLLLALVIGGGAWTVVRRLGRIARAVKQAEEQAL